MPLTLTLSQWEREKLTYSGEDLVIIKFDEGAICQEIIALDKI